MNIENILYSVLIIILTIISGYSDSRGFIHASKIWVGDQLIWSELGKSALGFAIGIFLYWIIIKFLPKIGVASSTELQTIGWFSVTMVGVAISSGEIPTWNIADKTVVLIVMIGFGWLLFRGH